MRPVEKDGKYITLNTAKILRFLVSLWCVLYFVIPVARGHGRLLQPPSRSSLWRFSEFNKYKPKVNFNDNEGFCGGINLQWEQNQGKCGVCGDPWNQPVPRDNEDGGIYGRGIIVAKYSPGQVINVLVELTTNHLGFFRLRLCPRDSLSTPLTQDCFNQHRLYFTDDSKRPLGTMYKVGDQTGYYNASVIIPHDVTRGDFVKMERQPADVDIKRFLELVQMFKSCKVNY